jgi:DNA replication protein DnaC
MRQQLHKLIDLLRLRGMSKSLDELLTKAQHNDIAIEDILLQLLESEYQDRSARTLENRLRNAKIPWEWHLDTFPFKKQPAVKKSQIMSLAKLEFIKNFENVIFIGKPGAGKTGLAISLLRLALINGYRGRFYNAQDLLNELYTSLADRTTSSLLKTIANYDVLIIDELGYLTLTSEQINIFFKLIDMRYHKKSTIITTNLSFDAWYDVFKHKELVDAMLDRFKHYCTTIHINGKSLRTPSENQDVNQE